MAKIKFFFNLFLFLFFASSLFSFYYKVQFQGVENKTILKELKKVSETVEFQKKPLRSINELKFRIENDIDTLKKLLHSYGFLDADISFDIVEDKKENFLKAYIYCNLYTRYILTSYSICLVKSDLKNLLEKCDPLKIDLTKIGIELKTPLNAKKIINSKYQLLFLLSNQGHPLAKIEKENIVADYLKKEIDVKIYLDKGPLCYFGPLTIVGLESIKPRYIYRKVAWDEKEPFSEEKIKETQKMLTATNLFSSVMIEHSKNLDEENLLPMKIKLTEAKHQNISLGLSYATVDGMGVMFGWAHRNIRKMGEVLSIQTDISKKGNLGVVTYKKPDFLTVNQDLVFQGYAIREKVKPYLSLTYGILGKIDHNPTKKFYYAYGVKEEYITVSQSANNGKFHLLGFPVNLRYTTTKHLLNPTEGYTAIYTITPSVSFSNEKTFFTKNRFSLATFIPTKKTKKIVLALRMQLGSILGSSVYKIPLNKLFLGGSDDDLRGYRYKTVGPRNNQNDLIGGRSFVYFNFEPRLRISQTIGIVPFLDAGNIKKCQFPTFKGRWRKSLGIGLRYFSFFGPLRLDVAFPLDKYKKSDPSYRFYVSLGQTF